VPVEDADVKLDGVVESGAVATIDDLPGVHELTDLEQLRALSDPLRVLLFRLLREREQTVKELCDQLGESSTRLYYHVGELERVGLVRLVRTEARAGIVQKYYRSIARLLYVPFTLFQQGPDSAEARAAVEWYGVMLEQAIVDLRRALRDNIQDTDPETIFATRNFIRVTPAKARELVARLNALQEEIIAADDPAGPVRFAYTSVLAPASFPSPDASPGAARGGERVQHPSAPHVRRTRRVHGEPSA
jgi:DNA-binding transcriptional ArsR family regulator